MTQALDISSTADRGELPSRSPLGAILFLTFLGSLGTGILWSGIAFIARRDFMFSAEENFLLYTVTALAYVAGAFASGPLTRAVQTRFTPRDLLGLLFGTQAAVCLLPLFRHDAWVLWFVAITVSVLAALLWPIVESYLTAGRHGAQMRSAMGWWNLSWTSAVTLALIGMAPLVESWASLAIVALSPASLLAAAALPWFAAAPASHEPEVWQASLAPEYPLLLRSARVLLPVSYLLIGALSPLMPFRIEDVGAPSILGTPATATWMAARVLAIALMWQLAFWHGRWSVLLAGGLGMATGFAILVAAPNMSLLLLGLGLFGAAQGVVYYAALYYAMSVGAAAVEAGGTHEGLIGVGYTAGPLAALAGTRLATLTEPTHNPASGIVAVVSVLLLVAALPAVQPYLRARRQR